jgi:hypothetical protein
MRFLLGGLRLEVCFRFIFIAKKIPEKIKSIPIM